MIRNKRLLLLVICLLLISIMVSGVLADDIITVLSPLSIRGEQEITGITPRFAEMDTVYLVDTQYPSTENFRDELLDALVKKYPEITWILRAKIGNFFDDDPDLWAEIEKTNAGAIVFTGH